MTKEALNIANQCRATASHDLACNIAVDGGSGLLRELLIDAARVIEALAQPEQRPWVGLTDEQIAEVAERMEASDPTDSFWREFARAIEAAHGIKENT